jgi:large subunit ribosomal protein L9
MLEVILKRDIENLGRSGEIVAVKPGYARNYLIPQGLALEATPGNRKRFAEERQQASHAQVRQREHADELALEIEGRSLTFTVRAGEDGKLFGSVTSSDMADALAAEGIQIDRHDIVLEEPIKELGVYRVPIRLHADVLPEVRVWVVAQE